MGKQGNAPTGLESRSWPNTKEAIRPRQKEDMSNIIALHLEHAQLSEHSEVVSLDPELTEESPDKTNAEVEQPISIAAPALLSQEVSDQSSRVTRMPINY